MRVVAIASCKGGAGKTTLAGHLAVAAERAGIKPVLVVDIEQLWADLDRRLAAKRGTIPSATPVPSGREEGAAWAA
jgi:cellulose biosynthesis protein BcsQ